MNGTPQSDPDNDDGSVDRELRAAFGELRDATNRLDTLAARRGVTDASRSADRSRRLLPSPVVLLAAIVLVAGIGAAYWVGDQGQPIDTAGLPSSEDEVSDSLSADDTAVDSTDPPGTTVDPTEPEQPGSSDTDGEGDGDGPGGESGTQGAGAVDDDDDDEPVELVYDESLTWSVVQVAANDTLNVRSGPGTANPAVTELAPDETGLLASTETVPVGGNPWRQVGRDDGLALGWVNERFLAASPVAYSEADESEMLSAAASAVTWLTDGSGAAGPADWLSPAGLDIGGIGIYADFPFPYKLVPASGLRTRQGWTAPVDFTPDNFELALDDCTDCLVSPLEFIKLPDPGRDYTLLADEDLVASGGQDAAGPTFRNGPVGRLAVMPHVTIDVPASTEGELDWQRIHLFFDWRTGEPLLHAIYTWGWTP